MSRMLTLNHGESSFRILREQTFDDTLLGSPLGDLSCLRVQIKGRTSSGVPHELLNDLEVLAIRYQECRVGMPKRVPSNFLPDAGSQCCRLNDLRQHSPRPVWLLATLARTGKDPILSVRKLGRFLP